MHLEELLQRIEQSRREFIAKRATKVGTTSSTAGVFPQGGNKGGKPAQDEIEPVLVEVGTGADTAH